MGLPLPVTVCCSLGPPGNGDGGVIFLGGGLQPQPDAGFKDNADNMYQCFKVDTEGAVDDGWLRALCNTRADTFNWLAENGVKSTSPQTDEG